MAPYVGLAGSPARVTLKVRWKGWLVVLLCLY
jgi:hypothetical protein